MAQNIKPRRATLFNPETGDRIAVDVDSKTSRDLFAKGFKLETNISNSPYATTSPEQQRQLFSNIHTAPSTPGKTATYGYMNPKTRDLDLQIANETNQGNIGQNFGNTQQGQQQVQQPQKTMDPKDVIKMILYDLQNPLPQGYSEADMLAKKNKLIKETYGASTGVTPAEMKMLSPDQQLGILKGRGNTYDTELADINTQLEVAQRRKDELLKKYQTLGKNDIVGSDKTGYYSINPYTGEREQIIAPVAQTPDYAAGTIGEYQFYAEQEKAAGRTPISYNEYQNMDANRKAASATGGIVGEYQFYVQQEKAAGRTPVSFNQYQDIDANRKKAINAASNASIGMTPSQATMFNSIVGKYSASPLIAASDRTVVLQNMIKEVNATPGDKFKQLSLVYSFVQALDTYQSAVREGELGLVNSVDSKIGQMQNYFQQVQNGQILRPETAKEMADTAQILVDSISSAAQRKEKMFQSQADTVGLGEQWRQFIGGFQQTYNPSQNNQLQTTDINGFIDILESSGLSDKDIYNELVNEGLLQPNPWAANSPAGAIDNLKKKNNLMSSLSNNKLADGNKGGQCGRFVNKLTGLGVGDSYSSKLAKMDKSIQYPEPGMIFTMPYKNTGHVGIILAINNDGTATVKDSNWGLDEKIKTHKIALSKMTGFTWA